MPFNQQQQHNPFGAIRRQFSSLSTSSDRAKYQLNSKSVSSPMVSDENPTINAVESDNAIASNLEIYKERCRTMEAENARLMANQRRIIADFNRKLGCHLTEIHCLNEQMTEQKKSNVELTKWTKSMGEDCLKAKELAREWQKFGQCSSQLMQKELNSSKLRMDQLEAKCSRFETENMELKRLCLYLDEQRQTMQTILAKVIPRNHFSSADECCCCGCWRDSSLPNSESPLEKREGEDGEENGRRKGGDKEGRMRMDREQEELLFSISMEVQNSTEKKEEEDEITKMDHTAADQDQNRVKNSLMRDQSSSSSRRINSSSGRMNFTNVIRSNNNQTTKSGGTTSINELTKGPSSTSADDRTVVLVDNELPIQQLLEVRELCTISEEEEEKEKWRETTKERLVRLRELGKDRKLLVLEDGGKEEGGMLLDERIKRRDHPRAANCSSSMFAQAGSMLESMMSEERRGGQEETFVTKFNENHRNSTGGSSTSSGAFSGTSRSCTEDDGVGEGMEQVQSDENDERDDDDLPPQMPLISAQVQAPLFLGYSPSSSGVPSPSEQRPSSSMGPQQSIRSLQNQQSSTLPRSNFPVTFASELTTINRDGHKKFSTMCRRTSLLAGESEPHQRLQQPPQGSQAPIRIRVRPPPSQLQITDEK